MNDGTKPGASNASLNLGYVYAAIGAVLPTVAVFLHKGLAVFFAVVSLAALGGYWKKYRALPTPPWALVLLLSLIVFWGAVSALWSIEPKASLSLATRLFGFSLGGIILVSVGKSLSRAERRTAENGLLLGFAVGLAVTIAMLSFDGALGKRLFDITPLYRFNQAVVLVVIMAFPVALVIWRRGRGKLVVPVLLAALMVGFLSESSSSFLGLLGALVVTAVTWFAPKGGIRALMAGTLVCILAMPWLVSALPGVADLKPYAANRFGKPFYITGLPPGEDMGSGKGYEFYPRVPAGLFPRLFIWKFSAERILERPLEGWGLNSSRFFSDTQSSKKRVLDKDWSIKMEPLPLHPHNAALQWWLELGFVGTLLSALVILFGVRSLNARRPTKMEAACFTGMVSSALLISFSAYGIWQGWWMGSLLIFAGIAAALMSEDGRTETAGATPDRVEP